MTTASSIFQNTLQERENPMEFDNRGILFRNYRKRQPKHPDVVGEATISGQKFKIAGWIKKGRKGEFHSLAFTEEGGQANSPSADTALADVPQQAPGNDIPF